jgi:hypothetical protein
MRAVRRIVTANFQTFRPLIIDRNILVEIEEILTLNSAAVEVSFFDDEYEYKSLAELDENPGVTIRQIQMNSKEPYSRLTLGKERNSGFLLQDSNRLFAEEGEKGHVLFLRIREALARRQRLLSRFIRWWIFVISATINVSTGYPPWHSFLNTHFGSRATSVIDWTTDLYQFTFIYFVWRGMSIIRLEQHPKGSFWARNREEFAKHAITVAISLVVGGIIGYLIGYLKK